MAIRNPFKIKLKGMESPAQYAVEVTPSDSEELSHVTRSLYVGVQGDLTVITVKGNEVTFKNAVGLIPQMVRQVKSTGTSADNIIGMY